MLSFTQMRVLEQFAFVQANTCEVIYVPGNHDEAVRSFLNR